MTGFEYLAIVFVAFIVAIVVSYAVAEAARKKGRSWAAFFWLSLLVNWLIMAIIVAVIAPIDSPNAQGRRPCPRCAEPISAQATICKHCASEVQPLPASLAEDAANSSKGLFVAGVVTGGLGLLWIGIYYASAAQLPFGAATSLNLGNWNILLGLLMLVGGIVAVVTSAKKSKTN